MLMYPHKNLAIDTHQIAQISLRETPLTPDSARISDAQSWRTTRLTGTQCSIAPGRGQISTATKIVTTLRLLIYKMYYG